MAEITPPEPHPSDIFPWLQPDEYLEARDDFVVDYEQQVLTSLSSDPRYATDSLRAEEVAHIFARAAFITQFMGDGPHISDDETPVRVAYTRTILNLNVAMTTRQLFTHNGEEIPDEEITPDIEPDITLDSIYLELNLNWVDKALDAIGTSDFPVLLIDEEKGVPRKITREQGVDLLGEYAEIGMVEEVGHAMYYLDHLSDPGKRSKFFSEIRAYPYLDHTRDVARAAEQSPLYRNDPIEKDGKRWVEEFRKRYYPRLTFIENE